MAKEIGLKIDGLKEITQSLENAQEQIPRAVRWALGRIADELRDSAHSNVMSSHYRLAHDMWGIKSRMSKKYPFTSEVGYFTDVDNWHIKFFERSHDRVGRGTIHGEHFIGKVRPTAESLAQIKMEESISQTLRDLGLLTGTN
jgi:hypothetical protein